MITTRRVGQNISHVEYNFRKNIFNGVHHWRASKSNKVCVTSLSSHSRGEFNLQRDEYDLQKCETRNNKLTLDNGDAVETLENNSQI